jgi:acetyl-CoA acetyltransferase
MLSHPYIADPLRAHDCAPVTDGAAVVILAAGDRARALCERPAWITGFEHRIDSASLGARDLTGSPSAASAGRAAGASRAQVAELHAPFTHQELILRRELELGDEVLISPSGGALGGNPMFAAGLARIGSAATEIMSGRAEVALGHATGGPALQQNLVCVMDANGTAGSNGRSA